MNDKVWRFSLIILLACLLFAMVLFVQEFKNYNKNLQIMAMSNTESSGFWVFFPRPLPMTREAQARREDIEKVRSAMQQHITKTWQ